MENPFFYSDRNINEKPFWKYIVSSIEEKIWRMKTKLQSYV